MNRKLFTIGYTGFNVDEFVGTLKHQAIDCLIDVREIPLSRKRGFSKGALAERLEQSGIGYRHLRLLGSPRSLRHEVRGTADFETFFAGVNRHLSERKSQVQITEAINVARHTRSCLMCCCSDWRYCHRKCVVDEILKRSFFFVEHLTLRVETSIDKKAA
jgi:uncharacterized protein (DUF488 family)